MLAAEVNGAPVRFLVDTGASLVFLTPDDARAAGLTPRDLDYTQRVDTCNGTVRAASGNPSGSPGAIPGVSFNAA